MDCIGPDLDFKSNLMNPIKISIFKAEKLKSNNNKKKISHLKTGSETSLKRRIMANRSS